jgi:hypothetical protein
MATLALDFDGVIHAYRKGWHDGTIYDEPVDGAFDAIRQLMTTYAVFIHTTREPGQVANWLRSHGFTATTDDSGPFWNERGILLITNRKLAAVAYIDDRAIRFTSWPQALSDLAATS